MIQATAQPKGAPVPSQATEKSIEKIVEDAVNQATQGVSGNVPPAERGRVIREQVRAAIDRARAEIDARRTNSSPEIPQLPFDPNNIIPPQVVDISLAFFVMLGSVIIGLPLARAFARRMDRKSSGAAAGPDVSPRLDRIEQAIEAVAIEVERISEGQRYATRVMSELRALPAPNPLESRPLAGAMKAEAIVEPAAERRP